MNDIRRRRFSVQNAVTGSLFIAFGTILLLQHLNIVNQMKISKTVFKLTIECFTK